MDDNNRPVGSLGLFLSGLVIAAAALFFVTGGDLGGKKKIRGDADLPPISSPEKSR